MLDFESTKQKTILLIEDANELLQLLKSILEMKGFRILSANNGEDALELLRNNPELPDLILLDMMMPIMSGQQFMEKKNQDLRIAAIPVVLLTAHKDALEAKSKLGARDFIKKPVELDEVFEVINRNLNN